MYPYVAPWVPEPFVIPGRKGVLPDCRPFAYYQSGSSANQLTTTQGNFGSHCRALVTQKPQSASFERAFLPCKAHRDDYYPPQTNLKHPQRRDIPIKWDRSSLICNIGIQKTIVQRRWANSYWIYAGSQNKPHQRLLNRKGETMFIELHIIQNFAPSNLNRDDSNSPKDCIFGGVRRARISSQCIKRSVRLHPAFAEETGVEPASRTRFLASAISKRLQELGKPQEEADLAASNFIGILLGGTDQKNPLQSKVLFYVSLEEKEQLTNLILENWEAALAALAGEKQKSVLEKAAKDYKKAFQKRTSAPDIAMFGRMLAEDPNLNMDAACQVAHAISTHRVTMEMDFFTAVDDLQIRNKPARG